jgi:flagellar protein FlgJ
MSYGSINGTSSFNQANQSLAADAQSLAKLKLDAGSSTPESIKEAAKQFESLFMKELIKSMRDANASMKSGMLDNAGSDLGTDLLDQQFAVQMSGQPGGLSQLIAAQLTRQAAEQKASSASSSRSTGNTANTSSLAAPASTHTRTAFTKPASDPAREVAALGKGGRPPRAHQVEFVNKLSDAAARVEQSTGIPASYMIGQAGHETAWGQREIKHKGGASSFNLFGIKATPGWTGKVAEVTTTEYVNGVAQKGLAKFRAYSSYEESFKDYARLIGDSPRYARAKLQTSSPQAFASGLQKAGYATDPDYAAKLSRAINTTLQMRRVQV